MFLGTKTLNVGLRVTIDDGACLSQIMQLRVESPQSDSTASVKARKLKFIVRKSDMALSIPCFDSYFDLFVSPLGETMHHCDGSSSRLGVRFKSL